MSLSSRSNNCLYHSSLVIKTSPLGPKNHLLLLSINNRIIPPFTPIQQTQYHRFSQIFSDDYFHTHIHSFSSLIYICITIAILLYIQITPSLYGVFYNFYGIYVPLFTICSSDIIHVN